MICPICRREMYQAMSMPATTYDINGNVISYPIEMCCPECFNAQMEERKKNEKWKEEHPGYVDYIGDAFRGVNQLMGNPQITAQVVEIVASANCEAAQTIAELDAAIARSHS